MNSPAAADLSYSRSVADKAVETMIAYGVAPTPRNYEIWYALVAGHNVDLAQAVDTVFQHHGSWSDEHSQVIHERFFSARREAEAMAEISSGLDQQIETMMKTVTAAGRETETYGHALEAAASDIRSPRHNAQAVVQHLTAATAVMRSRIRNLEAELATASQEVTALRTKNELIRKEARTDRLTRLPNRAHFDERFAEAAALAKADGTPLSLLMGDVDHFKHFNDTWGHQVGDQVLRLVGSCFSDNVKGRDTAARYGGEEFAVILPETALQNARTLAEQIRQSVQAKRVVKRSTGESLGTISISIGVSCLKPDEDPAEALRRADACLYAAKRAGRNRVIGEDQTDAGSL